MSEATAEDDRDDEDDSLHLLPYVMRPGDGPVDVEFDGKPMGKQRDRLRRKDVEDFRRIAMIIDNMPKARIARLEKAMKET